jgi:hypothetical protein
VVSEFLSNGCFVDSKDIEEVGLFCFPKKMDV